MQSDRYKLIEFCLIYIVLPVSFVFDYPFVFKVIFTFLGFFYVIYVLLKVEGNVIKIAPNLNWRLFFVHVGIKLVIIAFMTIIYMWFTSKSDLFHLLYIKPKLWVMILFAYAVFSAYPQELIYRSMFFQRYKMLVKNKTIFIFLNASIFSLAHIFYRNPLVLLITFLGGILFALTYDKTRSTLLVSIEHTIYGCWLFTVGMGAMLGFPS